MQEFITDALDLSEDEEDAYTEFKVDGRVLRAYTPNEGQLTFMMAMTGRGMTDERRYSSIVAVLLESLRGDDRDYFEERLLTSDNKRRLSLKVLTGIFEFLAKEWFGRPTQPASDSAPSEPNAG